MQGARYELCTALSTAVDRRRVTDLAMLTEADRLLAACVTAADAVDLIDFAEAARVYAQRAKLGTSAVNHATTVKLLAERRLADAVDAGQQAGTIAQKGGDHRSNARSAGIAPTLTELGVRSQRLAEARTVRDAYTDDDLRRDAEQANAADRVLSRRDVVKRAAHATTAAAGVVLRAEPVAPPTGTYSVIAADPPWQYGNAGTRNAAGKQYPTMTIAQICDLAPTVKGFAADESHLYLWTTNNFLREAFDVMDAWGFEYKTLLTWVKPQMGLGNYFRSGTEHALFGTRGKLPTQSRSAVNWFQAARGRHSAKPQHFYELVEQASPGPYLEMFARTRRLGWDSWGNEA